MEYRSFTFLITAFMIGTCKSKSGNTTCTAFIEHTLTVNCFLPLDISKENEIQIQIDYICGNQTENLQHCHLICGVPDDDCKKVLENYNGNVISNKLSFKSITPSLHSGGNVRCCLLPCDQYNFTPCSIQSRNGSNTVDYKRVLLFCILIVLLVFFDSSYYIN